MVQAASAVQAVQAVQAAQAVLLGSGYRRVLEAVVLAAQVAEVAAVAAAQEDRLSTSWASISSRRHSSSRIRLRMTIASLAVVQVGKVVSVAPRNRVRRGSMERADDNSICDRACRIIVVLLRGILATKITSACRSLSFLSSSFSFIESHRGVHSWLD